MGLTIGRDGTISLNNERTETNSQETDETQFTLPCGQGTFLQTSTKIPSEEQSRMLTEMKILTRIV